ncbi:MAG: hypothetical protein QM802_18330 [Agriterribacter sp.]
MHFKMDMLEFSCVMNPLYDGAEKTFLTEDRLLIKPFIRASRHVDGAFHVILQWCFTITDQYANEETYCADGSQHLHFLAGKNYYLILIEIIRQSEKQFKAEVARSLHASHFCNLDNICIDPDKTAVAIIEYIQQPV